jgi:hypothetical protein
VCVAQWQGWGSGLALRYCKTRPDPAERGRAWTRPPGLVRVTLQHARLPTASRCSHPSRLHAWSSVGKSGPRHPEHRRPSVAATPTPKQEPKQKQEPTPTPTPTQTRQRTTAMGRKRTGAECPPHSAQGGLPVLPPVALRRARLRCAARVPGPVWCPARGSWPAGPGTCRSTGRTRRHIAGRWRSTGLFLHLLRWKSFSA